MTIFKACSICACAFPFPYSPPTPPPHARRLCKSALTSAASCCCVPCWIGSSCMQCAGQACPSSHAGSGRLVWLGAHQHPTGSTPVGDAAHERLIRFHITNAAPSQSAESLERGRATVGLPPLQCRQLCSMHSTRHAAHSTGRTWATVSGQRSAFDSWTAAAVMASLRTNTWLALPHTSKCLVDRLKRSAC